VRHSKRFTNAQGVEQGTCVHLGNCDIGCEVDARNTLDRNYLALAERKGADVRPLHLVTNIEPAGGGYKVSYDRIEAGAPNPRLRTGAPRGARRGIDGLDRDAAALPRRVGLRCPT
jgi:cholesterol oxidase